MKLRITFKDPDGPYEDIRQSCLEQISKIEGLDDDEIETLLENRIEKVNEALEKWIVYGEYVTIDFDLEAGTAEVLSKKMEQ